MKCYDKCLTDKFEYDSICVSNCPEGTYKFLKDIKKCIKNLQENYYLDGNDNIYKECYKSCQKCYGKGDITNNNCEKHKSGFMFSPEPNKEKNCFECSYYYYINDSGNYCCTNDFTCPQAHKNLISEKKKCINKCLSDSTYQYEYNNECYQACPDGKKSFNDNKICVSAYKYNNKDYEQCPSNTKTDNEDMKCYDECPKKNLNIIQFACRIVQKLLIDSSQIKEYV